MRGASFNNEARNLRAANRNRNEPDNRNNNLGFRCVRDVGPRARRRNREGREPARPKAEPGVPFHFRAARLTLLQPNGGASKSVVATPRPVVAVPGQPGAKRGIAFCRASLHTVSRGHSPVCNIAQTKSMTWLRLRRVLSKRMVGFSQDETSTRPGRPLPFEPGGPGLSFPAGHVFTKQSQFGHPGHPEGAATKRTQFRPTPPRSTAFRSH